MYFIGMKLSLKSPITLNLNQLEQKSADRTLKYIFFTRKTFVMVSKENENQ